MAVTTGAVSSSEHAGSDRDQGWRQLRPEPMMSCHLNNEMHFPSKDPSSHLCTCKVRGEEKPAPSSQELEKQTLSCRA